MTPVSPNEDFYVVEVTQPGHETKYLSANGINDEGPLLDNFSDAAQFQRKEDARHFANITKRHVDGNPAVVHQSDSVAYKQEQLDIQGTQELRQEALDAYDAWQQDPKNVKLEYEYFDKPDAWLPIGSCRLLLFPVNALKPHRYPPIAPNHVRVGWCLWI